MTDLLPNDAESSDGGVGGVVDQARQRIVAKGYTGRFEVSRSRIFCCSCRSSLASRDVRWHVVEVVSHQRETIVVGGIRCPVCNERGVASTTLDLFGN